jgi:hypothetical protein
MLVSAFILFSSVTRSDGSGNRGIGIYQQRLASGAPATGMFATFGSGNKSGLFSTSRYPSLAHAVVAALCVANWGQMASGASGSARAQVG